MKKTIIRTIATITLVTATVLATAYLTYRTTMQNIQVEVARDTVYLTVFGQTDEYVIGELTAMNEFEKVLITIQMKNDSENAETCFTITMTETKAYALLNEIGSWHTNLGEAILSIVKNIANGYAYLMGYYTATVASAEILH